MPESLARELLHWTHDDQPHKPYHVRVYAPDGVVINVSSVADAQRICWEMNKIAESNGSRPNA